MLISRSKKAAKIDKKPDSVLKKGLLLLKDKLYKQAVVELKAALEKNPEQALPELKDLFTVYDGKGNMEKALAVGLALFQPKKDEKLGLKLGNYSRELQDYKQANNLYRQILKINQSNSLAFYNLAASLGKVEVYDDDIRKLIDKYFVARGYVLPSYLDENKAVNKAKKEIEIKKLDSKTVRVQELITKLEEMESEGEYVEALKIQNELKQLNKEAETASFKEIYDYLHQRFGEMLDRDLNKQLTQTLHNDIFNFGIYALSQNKTNEALESFLMLKEKKAKMNNLDLCIALATEFSGDREEALVHFRENIAYDKDNRLLNVNLAIFHMKNGNRLLSLKYKIVASALLQQSEGLIHFHEIMDRANAYFKLGRLENALRLYQIAAVETGNIRAWLSIGEIHIMQNRHPEAVEAYKQIRRIDPESEIVQEKLLQVHDIYCDKADQLLSGLKFSQAAVVYERALKLVRHPKTIGKLIDVYKRLNKSKLVQELFEEQQELQKKEAAVAKEIQRNEFIKDGKAHLMRKNYEGAISAFESAFNIRADSDVFSLLAQIYKGLKRSRMLKDLMERWSMIKEKEEAERKMQAFKEANQEQA